MSNSELAAKVRKLKNVEAKINTLMAEADGLRDQIKAHMGDQEELRVGCFKVMWKRVKAFRLDSTSLKAELPEVAARYTVKNEYRRFSVA